MSCRLHSEMGRRQLAEMVLNLVHVVNRQVAQPRFAAQQLAHLREGLRVDLATLGRLALALPGRLQCHDRDRPAVHCGTSKRLR